MTYDPFETSSGLIDHYIGTVTESWFGVNAQYNTDLTLIFWNVQLANPEEFPQVEEGMIKEQFSIGPNWESNDGGKTVEYPGRENAKFNGNTQYGKIINRAVQEWGMKDVLLSKGGSPMEAGIWVGSTFEFHAEPIKPFKNKEGELVTPNPKVMPVAYLGEGAVDLGGGGAKIFDMESLGIDDAQMEELQLAATSAGSFGKFLDQAMKLPWVGKTPTVVAALADQSLYETLTLTV